MNKRLLRIALCILLAAGAAAAVIYLRSAGQRGIVGRYAELDSAMSRKDLAGYMALLTPDYTEIRLNQKPRDRAHAEAVYSQIFNDWSGYAAEPVEVDAFNRSGDTIKATVKRVGTGDMTDRAGAFGAKGVRHKMKTVSTNIDVWRKSRDEWLLQRRVIALAMVFVDGKIVPGGTVHDDD